MTKTKLEKLHQETASNIKFLAAFQYLLEDFGATITIDGGVNSNEVPYVDTLISGDGVSLDLLESGTGVLTLSKEYLEKRLAVEDFNLLKAEIDCLKKDNKELRKKLAEYVNRNKQLEAKIGGKTNVQGK